MAQNKILIIVPAYNEAGCIRQTVQEIFSLKLPVEVLVVDDGSHDQTAKEAKSSGAQVVSLPFNTGIGGAIQTGFQFALRKGFDVAVQVDADGQHDVAYLNELLKPVVQNQADLAIGSRFLPPDWDKFFCRTDQFPDGSENYRFHIRFSGLQLENDKNFCGVLSP